jgi:hypothetical protein
MGYNTSLRLRVFCDFHPAEQDEDVDRSEFYGRSESYVYRLARDAGWKFYPSQHKAMCPRCRKEGKDKRAA